MQPSPRSTRKVRSSTVASISWPDWSLSRAPRLVVVPSWSSIGARTEMPSGKHLTGGVLALLAGLLVWALIAGNSEKPIDRELAARYRAMRAEVESGLKNAATAAETYAVDDQGSYLHADESDLIALGLQLPEDVTWAGRQFEESSYCIVLEHQRLPRDHPWRVASYSRRGQNLPSRGLFLTV